MSDDLIARARRYALPDPHDEREVPAAALVRELANALAAERARADAAERDAERYRWIRKQPHLDIALTWILPTDAPRCLPNDPATDAAIDAARKENPHD